MSGGQGCYQEQAMVLGLLQGDDWNRDQTAGEIALVWLHTRSDRH